MCVFGARTRYFDACPFMSIYRPGYRQSKSASIASDSLKKCDLCASRSMLHRACAPGLCAAQGGGFIQFAARAPRASRGTGGAASACVAPRRARSAIALRNNAQQFRAARARQGARVLAGRAGRWYRRPCWPCPEPQDSQDVFQEHILRLLALDWNTLTRVRSTAHHRTRPCARSADMCGTSAQRVQARACCQAALNRSGPY
jgi:hypothetical protein